MKQILKDFKNLQNDQFYKERMPKKDNDIDESYDMMKQFVDKNMSDNEIQFFQILVKINSGPLYTIIGNYLSECKYR